MAPVNGINPNIALEKERLDINANVTPSYLINQDRFIPPSELSNTGSDFSAAGQRAIAFLKGRETTSLNWIPNLGEPSPPPPPPPSPTPAPTPAGSHGVNSGEDVEGKAVDAAEDLMDEANSLSNDLKEGNWTITDSSGYQYVDPEFYVKYAQLISILNALQIIAAIIDAVRGIKDNILEIVGGSKKGNTGLSENSAAEVLGVAREVGMLTAQGQLLQMTEAVSTENNRLLSQRTEDAKRNAKCSWYDIASEVVTSGGSDATSRHKDARYADAVYAEMQKYEAFQQYVQHQYEAVLGNNSYINALTGAGDIFKSLNWMDMTVDIGGGKVDIDRNQLLAQQMKLTSVENYRRLYAMIKRAIQELKDLIVEGTMGVKISSNTKRIIEGVLESLDKFESMVFSAMTYQLQSSIAGQNMRVDAYNQKELAESLYDSSIGGLPGVMTLFALFSGDTDTALASLNPLGGSIPLIGGLTKNISDYFALAYWNAKTDDATNPTQLDMNQVYQILADITGTSLEQVREDINSADEHILELDGLEKQEWEVTGRLNDEYIVITHKDGTQEINEFRVNLLREELNSIQNKERILVMGVEAIARLAKIVIKISTQQGDIRVGEGADAAIKAGMENRATAFDLKFAGIKNKVDAHNKEVKEKKQLEKAKWVAAGSFVGMGVAAVILAVGIIAFPPLGVIGAIGFIAAVGQLGAAISTIAFNSANPVDDRIYDQTRFYIDKAKNSIEESYDQEIDRISENSHINAENSSDPMKAGNQWATDTKLFMNVRNNLTRIYFYEQILLMYTKAFADIGSMATMTGMGGEDFEWARGASSGRFTTKIKAYQLKEDMVDDIISRRNLAVSQDTELNWAILSAAISAAQIVTFGIANEATGEAAKTWGMVNFGTDLAGMAVQATKHYLDATSGYDELGDFNAIKDAIEEFLKTYYGDDQNVTTIRSALEGINEGEMVESIGSGKVIANSSSYYQAVRQIQRMFNRIILMLRVAEGIARVIARISGASTAIGASEAFEAEKANQLKQLEILFKRVQTYVERSNAMADAWRQFTVTVCLIAFKIMMKIAQENGLINKLKQTVKFGEVQFSSDPVKSTKWIKFLTGDKTAVSNGKIALSSLLIDIMLNQQVIAMIARKVYDATRSGKHQAVAVAKIQRASTDPNYSRIDQMEDTAYNNQLDLAEVEVGTAALEIEEKLKQELIKFVANEVNSAVDGLFDERWKMSTTLTKAMLALQNSNPDGVAVPGHILVDYSEKVKLEQADWSTPDAIKKNFDQVKKYVDGYKQADGKPMPEEYKQRLIAASAFNAAEFIVKQQNPQAAVQALREVVSQQLSNNSRDIALLAYATAIMGSLTKTKGGEVSEKELDSLISQVWEKVASKQVSEADAEKICEYAQEFRPATVQTSRLIARYLAEVEQPQNVDPAKAKASKQDSNSKANDLFRSIHARARTMGIITGVEVDGKEWKFARLKGEKNIPEEVARQLTELKKDLLILIKLDARALGIDPKQLPRLLKQIEDCRTLVGIAEILQENLSNNKRLPEMAKRNMKEAVAILGKVYDKLNVMKTAQQVAQAAAQGALPKAMEDLSKRAPGLAERVKDELDKMGNKRNGIGDKVNIKTHDSGSVPVTPGAGAGGQGSSSSGGQGNNGRQKQAYNGLDNYNRIIKEHNDKKKKQGVSA